MVSLHERNHYVSSKKKNNLQIAFEDVYNLAKYLFYVAFQKEIYLVISASSFFLKTC